MLVPLINFGLRIPVKNGSNAALAVGYTVKFMCLLYIRLDFFTQAVHFLQLKTRIAIGNHLKCIKFIKTQTVWKNSYPEKKINFAYETKM